MKFLRSPFADLLVSAVIVFTVTIGLIWWSTPAEKVGLISTVQAQSGGRFAPQNHAPAAGSQATKTLAAVATKSHVLDCVIATFAGNASLALPTSGTVVIRDGVSGGGTVLGGPYAFAVGSGTAATVSAPPLALCGLRLKGSLNTAMTVEFAAGATNVLETVSFTGWDE